MAIIQDLNDSDEVWKVHMRDESVDGSGHSLVIPTLLVPKGEGDMLINAMKEGEVVL